MLEKKSQNMANKVLNLHHTERHIFTGCASKHCVKVGQKPKRNINETISLSILPIPWLQKSPRPSSAVNAEILFFTLVLKTSETRVRGCWSLFHQSCWSPNYTLLWGKITRYPNSGPCCSDHNDASQQSYRANHLTCTNDLTIAVFLHAVLPIWRKASVIEWSDGSLGCDETGKREEGPPPSPRAAIRLQRHKKATIAKMKRCWIQKCSRSLARRKVATRPAGAPSYQDKDHGRI